MTGNSYATEIEECLTDEPFEVGTGAILDNLSSYDISVQVSRGLFELRLMFNLINGKL